MNRKRPFNALDASPCNSTTFQSLELTHELLVESQTSYPDETELEHELHIFTTPSPIMIMATSRPGQLNHDPKMSTSQHYNSRSILQSHSKDKLLISSKPNPKRARTCSPVLNMLSTAEAWHHEPIGSKVSHSPKKNHFHNQRWEINLEQETAV